MAQVEVLSTGATANFDYEFVSYSPSLSPSQNKILTNVLIESLLSTPQHHLSQDGNATEEINITGLPPLHYGHSDIHLRNGVMRASRLAADGEADAERAFFVADLSYVYQQHLRWQKILPEIHPFYGS